MHSNFCVLFFNELVSGAAFAPSPPSPPCGPSLKVGDCVFLKSPGKLPYVALVDWVGDTQIRCRWFYRYAELPPHVRKSVDACCCEIFLSSHQDVNDMSSVIKTCTVSQHLYGSVGVASATLLIDNHIVCRYVYDIAKKSLSLVSDWKDACISYHSDGALPSTQAASQDYMATAPQSEQAHIIHDGTL